MQISAYSGAVAAVARPELNSQEKHLAVLVATPGIPSNQVQGRT
jgi:hypothetical protein